MLCLIGVYISSIASNSLSVYYLPLFSLLHSGLLGSSVCFLYTNHFQSVSECAPSDVPSLSSPVAFDLISPPLNSPDVAFSAALTNSDETLGPSERDVTLIFKHVVTNIGNAYNPHTGFFTAPVRGAYHFEWHIGDIGGRSPATAAALVKNSERVFSAYANLTPSHFETSSESATLQLEAGDVVSVNKWATSGIYDNVNHHVTFSGHLLFTM
uniref:C1q domain-containing protein n=1 Tax=Monopterus albus TaxID=43700 RepID=A0A3Q3KEC7_MONAL